MIYEKSRLSIIILLDIPVSFEDIRPIQQHLIHLRHKFLVGYEWRIAFKSKWKLWDHNVLKYKTKKVLKNSKKKLKEVETELIKISG